MLSSSLLTRQVNQYLAQQRLEVKRELSETKRNKKSAIFAILDRTTITSNIAMMLSSALITLGLFIILHSTARSSGGIEEAHRLQKSCDDDDQAASGPLARP